ncbi:uncharacterized protein K460DRAFT_284888 [Cucurbitaria berberidis CBS 394.84]|uniref:Uncharacterized protein n=1 Tax=Cucurbitaria berberidis CBS 394.84 TaxID=1168544 RepID=A0A9P4L9A3_9PLEO|nr:uncharacterized protein K460DRAFT_284888 [Cucurbitaria berberidis CBS 394.84]KAF1846845.1 hypothetical protein K460DRAFT_284888 [Cucurbitaria berberidis CBS 394.84]
MAPIATLPHLVKRDDDYAIPPFAIILLIMVGSALLVCCGFAIHSVYGFGEDTTGIKPMSNEQEEYMNEVRARNLEALMYEGAKGRAERRT